MENDEKVDAGQQEEQQTILPQEPIQQSGSKYDSWNTDALKKKAVNADDMIETLKNEKAQLAADYERLLNEYRNKPLTRVEEYPQEQRKEYQEKNTDDDFSQYQQKIRNALSARSVDEAVKIMSEANKEYNEQMFKQNLNTYLQPVYQEQIQTRIGNLKKEAISAGVTQKEIDDMDRDFAYNDKLGAAMTALTEAGMNPYIVNRNNREKAPTNTLSSQAQTRGMAVDTNFSPEEERQIRILAQQAKMTPDEYKRQLREMEGR